MLRIAPGSPGKAVIFSDFFFAFLDTGLYIYPWPSRNSISGPDYFQTPSNLAKGEQDVSSREIHLPISPKGWVYKHVALHQDEMFFLITYF